MKVENRRPTRLSLARAPVVAVIGACLVSAPAAHAAEGVDYERCNEQASASAVPAASVADRIPAGFRALPPESQLPPSLSGAELTSPVLSGLNVLVIECTVAGEQVREALGVVPVAPPSARRREGADWHYLALWGVTTSADARSRYQAWGFGETVETGDVTFDVAQTPGPRAGWATAQTPHGSVGLTTAVPAPAARTDGGRGRLFAAPGGEVAAIDVTWTPTTLAFGAGLLQLGGAYSAGLPLLPAVGLQVYGDDVTNTLTPVEGAVSPQTRRPWERGHP